MIYDAGAICLASVPVALGGAVVGGVVGTVKGGLTGEYTNHTQCVIS